MKALREFHIEAIQNLIGLFGLWKNQRGYGFVRECECGVWALSMGTVKPHVKENQYL